MFHENLSYLLSSSRRTKLLEILVNQQNFLQSWDGYCMQRTLFSVDELRTQTSFDNHGVDLIRSYQCVKIPLYKVLILINNKNFHFLIFPACFSIPIIFSNLNYNCSNLLDMRNLQEQVKKAFCYQKLFWPFTVWINCSSDLKNFANSRSLEHFFSQ